MIDYDPYGEDYQTAETITRTDQRIPTRYRQATTEHALIHQWIDAITQTATQARKDNPASALAIRTGPSLFISGPVGTGKTYQAYGALRAIAARGIRARWEAVSAPDLYSRLRPRPGVDSEIEFRTVASLGLLLLDDLAAAKATEWTEEVTYRLINHRYEHQLATIFTTNLKAKEIATAVGERIASRLAEMCTVVPLTGEDRRKPTS
jgi:DNA replication protein DnaC